MSDLRLGVDAETRLTDLQSFERRVRLKLRDDPSIDGCLLAIADTRHNRAIPRANPDAFGGFERIRPADLPGVRTRANRLVLL